MQAIIKKYIEGKISDKEERKLYQWLLKKDSHRDIFKKEIELYERNNDTTIAFDPESAFTTFKNNIKKQKTSYSLRPYLQYAAAIAILIASSVYIFQLNNTKTITVDTVVDTTTEIEDRIILTTNNGKTNKIIEKQEQLSYIGEDIAEEIYNEISIPKGAVFKLILSDSTIVWLNADTKFTYPQKFSSKEKTRTVHLTGEAYFEVSHNPDRPFIVQTEDINVQVLGTKFNVSSYKNLSTINTTLVEGSVNIVDSKEEGNSILITPDHQASFDNKNKEFSSKKVNTSLYTAWMQKKIIFQDTPFNELIKKIERAYGVKIINNNTSINNKLFTGQFDIENVETIFKALSTTIPFTYEINKNQIIIK